MALTARFIGILTALRRYFYLRTADIRDMVVPADADGSITRECMRNLLKLGFVRRHEPRLLEVGRMTAPPIYVLTLAGSCALATETGDCSLMLTVEPTFRDWLSLSHYLSLSRIHWTIDGAFAAQSAVTQHALYFEHEVIRPDADEPSKKYRLNTKVTDAVSCCPDSAFETEYRGSRRAWYVEREMGSDTPGRVAGKKSKGYAALGRFFQRHFPHATDFRVLAICPNAGWRDMLVREMVNKPAAELWLFCAIGDVTVEKFLHEPIFYKLQANPEAAKPGEKMAVRGPLPLIPRPPAVAPDAGGSAV
jgi:hypothetical protein